MRHGEPQDPTLTIQYVQQDISITISVSTVRPLFPGPIYHKMTLVGHSTLWKLPYTEEKKKILQTFFFFFLHYKNALVQTCEL